MASISISLYCFIYDTTVVYFLGNSFFKLTDVHAYFSFSLASCYKSEMKPLSSLVCAYPSK